MGMPMRAWLATLLLLTGCDGCGRDKPYVPYVVGDESRPRSVADAEAPAAAEVEDAGSLALEPALVAPPGTRTWNARGVPVDAGQGRELALVLVRDVDGDGRDDALVVTRPPLAGEGAGKGAVELFLVRGSAPDAAPRKLASGPPFREGDACVPAARLERIGPRSALSELGVVCQKGGSARSVVVARLSGAADLAFEARIHDPEGSPRISLEADGADRDRDGIDDVALRLTLEPLPPPFEPTPRMTAKLSFFDRPAGASRDADEPEASLRGYAGRALARASKPKEAGQVLAEVAQIRALYRALCAEGGAPRVSKRGGGALVACGNSKALEDAAVAEVRALAALGDAPAAIAAADAAQRPPATKTAARSTEMDAALNALAKPAEPRSVKEIAVAADAPARHPAWGPLAFAQPGKLLVREGSHVREVDVETGEVVDAAASPWATNVTAPFPGLRFLEAYHACEGLSLRATFTTGEGDMRDVPLPITPALGGRCAAGRGDQASVVPLAASDRGLEVLVAGQRLLVGPDGKAARAFQPLETPGAPGSPRAPDGHAFAMATSRGLLVRNATQWSLVRGDALSPFGDLRSCTAESGGDHAACIARGKVLLVTLWR